MMIARIVQATPMRQDRNALQRSGGDTLFANQVLAWESLSRTRHITRRNSHLSACTSAVVPEPLAASRMKFALDQSYRSPIWCKPHEQENIRNRK